jgi:PH (Pleckstrin Homology) domain-containing protein
MGEGASGPVRAFPLAPMSRLIRILTIVLLALPVYLGLVGYAARGLAGLLLLPIAGLLVALDVFVWFFARPLRFEIWPDALWLIWPARQRRIPLADVTDAHVLTGPALRQRLGWGGRIGVGGLWGGFGWAWTSRRGLVDLYVSRQDDLVLVDRRVGRSLLISPDEPEAFVRALRGAAGRS